MGLVRSAWRILVAVKDGLVLLFLLLFFGLLYAALSWSPKPATSSATGALLLDLKGTLVEQPQESDPISLLSGGGSAMREYRLHDVVHAIETATSDSKVKAIVLNLDGFIGGGQVALSRVGVALDGARKANKPVLAFATGYSDDSYQLAAHASEVWLNPIGGVMLSGPGGSNLYYKGLIDRLGVTTNIYRVGTYKSFVEPFTRTDQSPEARSANEALVGAVWQNWQDEVAKARPKARIAGYIADPVAAVGASGGDMAKAAVSAGLADKLGNDTQFGQRVMALAGKGKEDIAGGYAALDLDEYLKANPRAKTGQIGIVTVAGNIVDGEAGPGTAAGDTVAEFIRKAVSEKKYKALVVRIDSPGGSVLASEQIRTALLEAKASGLPIVASMGNVAASGGYWIATAADTIYAEPSTITGSIGVFGILPSFEGALAKLGITTDGVRTTPLSGEPDILGGVSDTFNTLAQASVEDIYRRFVGLVATARKMPVTQVDAIAQGRVWDGGTARQLKLTDSFGGLDEAVAEAARRAKLDPETATAVWIEKEPDFFTGLFESIATDRRSAFAAGLPRDWLTRQSWMQRQLAFGAVADARGMLEGSAIRATCLECAGLLPVQPVKARERGFWAGLLGWL